MLVVPVVE